MSYDPATKVWTAVFAVSIAAIIDWLAVLLPGSDFDIWWWRASLGVACLPSVAWVVEHIRVRNFEGMVMWLVTLAALVCAQFVLLDWAQSR